MQENSKNVVVVLEFIFILLIILILNFIKKDEQISTSERRKLAQFPKITINTVFNGKASEQIEKYLVDQFIARDSFKKIKYWFNLNILKQKDNNKLFVKNDSIYKMEYPLNKNAIESSSKKIQSIYEKYLNGMDVYYSIIPDKNYYLDDEHLRINYVELEKIMKENLKNLTYIDIKNELKDDYFYRTDLHWKQEKICNVADLIKKNMGVELTKQTYKEEEAGKFYGVYYGQIATYVSPDIIKYITNDTINNCITYNYETNKEGKIYDLEKYATSIDKYDIFLSGATPLLSIKNPNAKTNNELLMFRDSFGSSIVPFMVEDYETITLIDLRYINSELLGKYIEFKDQDVLFLYCGTVLNQNILK